MTFEQAVEEGTKELDAVSAGTCDGCDTCVETFDEVSGELLDEGRFSGTSCGICGSHFGGNRFAWHWLDSDNELRHEDNACTDCVLYLANGDVPEGWQRYPGAIDSAIGGKGELA